MIKKTYNRGGWTDYWCSVDEIGVKDFYFKDGALIITTTEDKIAKIKEEIALDSLTEPENIFKLTDNLKEANRLMKRWEELHNEK